MELITKVELPSKCCEIKHSERIMLIGSCFADNIGNKLEENKFHCDRNPFGVLYNPMSIHTALSQLVDNKVYTLDDLMCYNNIWFSLMHHSSFSSYDIDECLNNINTRMMKSSCELKTADWLILTFGTARVYTWNNTSTRNNTSEVSGNAACGTLRDISDKTITGKSLSDSRFYGKVVGNCHKLPEKYFSRHLLDVEEIVSAYKSLIDGLRQLNPKLRILFTVSPIRHAKDGMHGNQLSKSVLLLAVDRICSVCDSCYYFPSYEIMMDELRDYRFYADDMLHPSSLAVEYIWNAFISSFFGKETLNIMKQWEEVRRGLSHKPFNPKSEAYGRFISQILLKIEELKEKFTYLDVENEIKLCQTLLKK